jgi:DNA polymerase-3 subunit beta
MKGLDSDQYIDLPELFNSKKPDLTSVSTDNVAVDNRESAFFKADEISKITEKTVFACSTDEFRMAMNGVFFQFRNNVLNSVATDSYRLVKVSLHKEVDTFPDDLDVIIPQRTAELLKKSEDDVIFSLIRSNQKATHARFDSGNTVIISRLVDEKFPPYDAVIPKNNDLVAFVSHQDLLASLRRVSILTSKISNQVRLSFSQGLLTVIGEDEDAGDNASETLSCNYNSKNITIGFNCKYLEQALQNMHDYANIQQVAISFSEPNRPVLIAPEPDNNELLMLIMPVRV